MAGSEGYDAVIVGARCAGAPLAAKLAAAGARVVLVDHKPPPADTVSTHFVFPNTLSRFAELGVLERLEQRHRLNPVMQRFRVMDFELAGEFTPIDGFSRGVGVRRPVLDQALLDVATDAGAETRFGAKVVELIGAGADEDPVRGVVLDDGGRIEAPWVIGADGRASTVANLLGLEKRRPMAGEFGMLFAYWRGLPETEFVHVEARPDGALNWFPCEDDVHLVGTMGPSDYTHGSAAEREARYLRDAATFPDTLPPEGLERAEMISSIVVAPETMLRGFFRQAAGPGWILVGDAGHFKHPSTAQGISDAIEQALFVAEALDGGERRLEDYEAWRDERAAEHYEWSFDFGSFPKPGRAEPLFGGLASDPEAAQALRDTSTRRTRPRSDVFTQERLAKWFASVQAPA